MSIAGKKMMSLLSAAFFLLSCLVLCVGYFNFDKSRIVKTNIFHVSRGNENYKCESFIDKRLLQEISNAEEVRMTSIERFVRFFNKIRDKSIYQNVLNYELICNDFESKGPVFDFAVIIKDHDYFDIKNNNIAYKWYFKSRIGTLYRMFSYRKPVIFSVHSYSYGFIVYFSIIFCAFFFLMSRLKGLPGRSPS